MSAVLDGVSPRARATDPVTSVDAGRQANLSSSQSQVLRFLLTHQGRDWTDLEMVSLIVHWAFENHENTFSDSRLRTARRELMDRGRVELTGEFRRINGRRHQVWRLTEAES